MAWPLLAAVAAAAAPVPETTAPEPVPDIEIIELEQERYRRMPGPATIGGEGPFRFMLDTGAQATVVSRDLAERLALFDRSPATLVGMASTRQVETTVIDDVTLGSRMFYIRRAPVLATANIGGADALPELHGPPHP